MVKVCSKQPLLTKQKCVCTITVNIREVWNLTNKWQLKEDKLLLKLKAGPLDDLQCTTQVTVYKSLKMTWKQTLTPATQRPLVLFQNVTLASKHPHKCLCRCYCFLFVPINVLKHFVQAGMTRRSNVKFNKPHGHLLMLGLRFISFFRVDVFPISDSSANSWSRPFSNSKTFSASYKRTCVSVLLDLLRWSVYCCNKSIS